MTIENVLAERGKRYGDFSDHAAIAQQLQDIIRDAPSWERMTPVMKQSLTVIADKIARICSGDPFYDDNWIDLQGYAKLVEDRLEKPKKTEVNITVPSPEASKQAQDAIKRWIDSERRIQPSKIVPLGGAVIQPSTVGTQLYNGGTLTPNAVRELVGERSLEETVVMHPGTTADFKG